MSGTALLGVPAGSMDGAFSRGGKGGAKLIQSLSNCFCFLSRQDLPTLHWTVRRVCSSASCTRPHRAVAAAAATAATAPAAPAALPVAVAATTPALMRDGVCALRGQLPVASRHWAWAVGAVQAWGKEGQAAGSRRQRRRQAQRHAGPARRQHEMHGVAAVAIERFAQGASKCRARQRSEGGWAACRRFGCADRGLASCPARAGAPFLVPFERAWALLWLAARGLKAKNAAG